MAATYPLEVVQATRWLQDPNHGALTGSALVAALDLRPWDPSVKALVSFPEILRMMDGALEWTEAVGDAFLFDQVAVMDAIQRLRLRAQSAGTLVTTPQQMVLTQDQAIGIIPADPQVVYVPMYDPAAVYGTWVYVPSPSSAIPLSPPWEPGAASASASASSSCRTCGAGITGTGITTVFTSTTTGLRTSAVTGPPPAAGNTTRSTVTGSLIAIRERARASWGPLTATRVATGRPRRRGGQAPPGAVARRRALPLLREARPRPA